MVFKIALIFFKDDSSIEAANLCNSNDCLGARARSEHQAVGGGGRRHVQELLHQDGPVQGQGKQTRKLCKLFSFTYRVTS